MPRGRPPQKPPVVEYYEVEKLLDKRSNKGNTEYLVKWRGFEEAEATWEDMANLSSAVDSIIEFEAHRTCIPEEPKAMPIEQDASMQDTPYFKKSEVRPEVECEKAKTHDFPNDETTEMK